MRYFYSIHESLQNEGQTAVELMRFRHEAIIIPIAPATIINNPITASVSTDHISLIFNGYINFNLNP